MQMKWFFLVLVVLMGSWLGWTSSLAAQDDEEGPVNVGLLYFTATVQADGVRLDWGTATELNTAGFIIQRSSSSSSFATLNDIGIVSGTGGVATGATYSEVDKTAVPGQTYTYKLVEIETDSSQHDLETVTIFFNPQPTATSIVIGNPTSRPSSTAAAATATATGTAVATQNASLPTATPRATTAPQPTATSNNSNTNTSPAAALQASPLPTVILNQAFNSNSAGSNDASADSANSGVVFAQEEPTSAAYPDSDAPGSDTPPDADSYPPGQEPPAEISPENPTPYPPGTNVDAVPTLAVIGSANPYPPETDTTAPSPSAEQIRGRILLWAGFLLALFIFISGVIGAIVLYRRRPN